MTLIKALGMVVTIAGGSLLAADWPASGSKEEKLVKHARAKPGDAKAGSEFFKGNRLGCMSCHGQPGKGGNVGPDLKGVGKRFDVEVLMQKVLKPRRGSAMPTDMAEHFRSGEEFANLIAYLQSQRD
jgi:mono/diheme cytochrome c family protein